MEFPAVGNRYYSDGSLGSGVGAGGYYWSSVTSTSNSGSAYYLYFSSSYLYVNIYNKQLGFSVRCVR